MYYIASRLASGTTLSEYNHSKANSMLVRTCCLLPDYAEFAMAKAFKMWLLGKECRWE